MSPNEFISDGMRNLRRAADSAMSAASEQAAEDAILFLAFGMERMCKGILHDVNPLFVLEANEFDSASEVLYLQRLTPNQQKAAHGKAEKSKGPNRRLLAFTGSMLRAAKFSATIEAHVSILLHLSDLRAIVVHRPMSEFEHHKCRRFAQRWLHPLVSGIAAEVGFATAECLGLHTLRLESLATTIVAEDKVREVLDSKLRKHAEQWESSSTSKDFRLKAAETTRLDCAKRERIEYQCPACDNTAVISIEADWDVEGSSGEGFITGVFVAGLRCHYCGLEIDDSEEIDLLKLNDVLYGDSDDF